MIKKLFLNESKNQKSENIKVKTNKYKAKNNTKK